MSSGTLHRLPQIAGYLPGLLSRQFDQFGRLTSQTNEGDLILLEGTERARPPSAHPPAVTRAIAAWRSTTSSTRWMKPPAGAPIEDLVLVKRPTRGTPTPDYAMEGTSLAMNHTRH
jgi:hypothetical protein